jgi:3',5'-cyclic AMP phosphodiesterase CpdA
MSYVIAHVTDTHLSTTKAFFRDNFAVVATALRARRPDLVVNTGDISVNGADLYDDLVTAREMHDAIGVPWLAVPGNHDVGDTQETARKQPIDDVRRQRWLEVFGPDRWVRDVPGWRLLGINAMLLGSDLAAAADQDEFIVEAAAGLGGRQLALFLHKPLFIESPADVERTGHSVTPRQRDLLLAGLEGKTPRLVCCGHLHEYRERAFGDLHQLWAPATAFTIADWFIPTHGGEHIVGYVEIRLEKDGTFTTQLVQPEGLLPLDLADYPEAYGDLRQIKAAMDAQKAQLAAAK